MSEHCGLHNKPFNPVGNDWRVTALICPDCEALKKRETTMSRELRHCLKVFKNLKADHGLYVSDTLIADIEAALKDSGA